MFVALAGKTAPIYAGRALVATGLTLAHGIG